MARSWYATYKAKPGNMLLGAVTESRTSRFQTERMARDRLDQVIELNEGRCEGEVVGSDLPPELFIHCGFVVTCVGCRCPGCGKTLTEEDAKLA